MTIAENASSMKAATISLSKPANTIDLRAKAINLCAIVIYIKH
jgi:hypothetical protein